MPPPDPDENPAWFSDVYVQYPLSETRFITSHGHLFSAWSDLRVITNNLSLVTYNRDSPAAISADQYLSLHRQLKAWFTSLPAPLTPENIVWPSQFKLQYVSAPPIIQTVEFMPMFTLSI